MFAQAICRNSNRQHFSMLPAPRATPSARGSLAGFAAVQQRLQKSWCLKLSFQFACAHRSAVSVREAAALEAFLDVFQWAF